MELQQLRNALVALGASQILVKFLAPNDNSKNQVYLSEDLAGANLIPAGAPVPGAGGMQTFKAPVDMHWLDDAGSTHAAPGTQLILYPQYPEVRLSGFLRGADWAPSEIMSSRDEGRVLVLGTATGRKVFAYACTASSPVGSALHRSRPKEKLGVFHLLPVVGPIDSATDSRARLLAALCTVSQKGWITPWALQKDGSSRPCAGTNCVGVTLESELAIRANGRPEPDFEGWEIKAHTVTQLDRTPCGAITLMTPEPTGGVYTQEGVEAFVRRFGYPDQLGRPDRLNFGGIHCVGKVTGITKLSLVLDGFDPGNVKSFRADGQLALVDHNDTVAASWSFTDLLDHWQRKHARAVYVSAAKRKAPDPAFRYGNRVLLAEGTDYLRFLSALAAGDVYYDPGIKLESVSTVPKSKKRSQFRIKGSDLGTLYHRTTVVDACA